jgi:hypothetical protein
MVDGARNALLGYLYQLLGTAVVSIRDVSSGSDAWAQLIARVGQGEVVSEEFGQDAVVHPAARPSSGVTAIQFKHSSAAGKSIERTEFIDILFAFDQSRRYAAKSGVTIEHFALVTNRQLDAQVRAIFDHKINPTPHKSLKIKTTRKNGMATVTSTKWLTPYEGDKEAAAAAWHAIIRSLEVFSGECFEADVQRLREFAARYGVLDLEWGRCLDSLVGAFVRETSEGRTVRVTREWLKELLVGDREAANLRFGCRLTPHITTICLNQLNHKTTTQHKVSPQHYLERDIQQQLHAEMEQFSVVFVTGGGGRGKSLAVINYLRSVADKRLVWSEGADTASERQVVEAITSVRLPSGPLGGVDRSLGNIRARLETANDSRRPLCIIDLDGIDEAPARIAEIRELINLCWARGIPENSPASVVVTCRSEAGSRTKADLISHWLGTPEPDLVQGVGFVALDNFSVHELVDAARLLNGEPEERIIRASGAGMAGYAVYSAAVPEKILLSLRHPVVWGCYASLPELDRNRVLDSNSSSLNSLAQQLHDRFFRRCQKRRSWRNVQMLKRTLPEIARSTANSGPPYPESTWDLACEQCIDSSEARDLYNESLSYGIIEQDSGRSWRWVHSFLVDYLITLDGGRHG